ncbi:MAG TPA: hypothetical protein VHO48_04085, partial [Anaerolineaceae bacterium]|nr:hypothetical protein [Anaerolineaceae bacterium]
MQKSLSLTTSSRKSKIRDRQWEAITGLLFILPALVLFVLFGLYPFLRTVQISFNEWDGISSSMRFIGLENYLLAFKD